MLEHSYYCTVCSGSIFVFASKTLLENVLENENRKEKEKGEEPRSPANPSQPSSPWLSSPPPAR